MKRSFVFAMALVVGLAMAACGGGTTTQPTTPPGAPTTATTEPEVREFSDVLYHEDLDGAQHVLTVYTPAIEGGPWPVVVMIHGFGAEELITQQIGDPWAAEPSAVAARGIVVFVPTWPELPLASAEGAIADWDASVERMACAVLFARAEAERYGGDPARLALYAESAGANLASILVFADPGVPEGCVAPSGPVVPDNLLLFEGDWLLMGVPGFRPWDRLLREEPRLMEVGTPWSHLDEAPRIPVHILDSGDPSLFGEYTDGLLALRDPAGDFRRDLDGLGAFDDGVVTFREVQRVLYDRLQSLGYEVAFHDLPDSSHNSLSEAALQVVADAILSRT